MNLRGEGYNRLPAERYKDAYRSIGVDTDAAEMTDDEWHEWIGAHNAVVDRKGLGVPVAQFGVEEELARRGALDDLLEADQKGGQT